METREFYKFDLSIWSKRGHERSDDRTFLCLNVVNTTQHVEKNYDLEDAWHNDLEQEERKDTSPRAL